jgi:hypothetical protein
MGRTARSSRDPVMSVTGTIAGRAGQPDVGFAMDGDEAAPAAPPRSGRTRARCDLFEGGGEG